MLCQQCGRENPSEARFCHQCGGNLREVCAHCGTELSLAPDLRFCFSCGADLGAKPSVSKGERRTLPAGADEERRLVTVLFADLVGFTAMSERMDPEDVCEVQDAYFAAITPPITVCGGSVEKFIGDALVAVFGVPHIHEEDPERAVRAALAMLQALEELNRRPAAARPKDPPSRLAMRIGVHTGLVVSRVGATGDFVVSGDTVNLASRLQGAAEPGTVLISDDTYKLISHAFDCDSLGPIRVKGKAEPVSAFRVRAPKPSAPKLRGLAGPNSPLVGRQAELTALLGALEHLQSGVGGIVALFGDAGMGKSRLVAELYRLVQDQPPTARVLWTEGHCVSYGIAPGYQPWLSIVQDLLGLMPEMSVERAQLDLQSWLLRMCPQDSDYLYPILYRLLSLSTADDPRKIDELVGEQLRSAGFDAVTMLVRSIADRCPLVIVCEDLHWIHPTSAALLEHLLELVPRTQILVICSARPYRDEAVWRIRERMVQHFSSHYTELWLDALPVTDTATLISHLLGLPWPCLDSKELGDSRLARLLQRVVESAEGNPFFAGQMIHCLVDREVIVQDLVTGKWTIGTDVDDVRMPETLQQLLTARIDRVPAAARRALDVASVIGRSFQYRVLETVLHGSVDLPDHLRVLCQHDIIQACSRSSEAQYAFQHHLLHEAAYGMILKRERAVLHGEVAEALQRLYAGRLEEVDGALAFHWEQANRPDNAVQALLLAGKRMQRVGASLEAVEAYKRGLQLAQAFELVKGPEYRLAFHEHLGDVYLEHLSLHQEALEHYQALLDQTNALEEDARVARKIAGIYLLQGDLAQSQTFFRFALDRLRDAAPTPESSRVRCGLAYLNLSQGNLAAAEELAQSALLHAEQIDDRRGLADANRILGVLATLKHDPLTALACAQRCLALYRELGHLQPAAVAFNNLADCFRQLGRLQEAKQNLAEGLKLAQRIGDTRDEALLLVTQGEVLLDQGCWDEACEPLERALCCAERSGVTLRTIQARVMLGIAYERVGRLADAAIQLESAEQLIRATGHARFLPEMHLALAHLRATQGRLEECCHSLDQVKALCQAQVTSATSSDDASQGLWCLCMGYAAACGSQWVGAVNYLEKSVRLLARTDLLIDLAKARMDLGVAYAQRNWDRDGRRACLQLRRALAEFERFEATGYMALAQAALDARNCRSVAPSQTTGRHESGFG